MEHKILKQSKNPFLKREEFALQINAGKNPSFADVRAALGKDENLVVVKSINGNFGRDSFSAEAVVYNSAEDKNKVEKISRKQRKKIAEEAKKSADAAKAGAQ
jgi:ribosomal protein S24E